MLNRGINGKGRSGVPFFVVHGVPGSKFKHSDYVVEFFPRKKPLTLLSVVFVYIFKPM